MSRRIVDLSLPFRHGMRGVSIEPHTSSAEEGYNTSMLHLYSHAGTHMDAPLHWLDGARPIDMLDLEKCVGPAHVIDLSHIEPNALIGVDDLMSHAERVSAGSRLLLRTDWDLHAEQADYRTHMPRISPALAHWFVRRQVSFLGLETPSVASLRPENFEELREVHRILLRAEIVIVECLANLRQLQSDVVHVIALPLKLDALDGSPVRAIAIEDLCQPITQERIPNV